MPALTEADAKRLTLQLKLLFGSVADQIDKVKKLIGQAKSGQADVALGYKSWTAYCETEFAGALPRLERQARRELVVNLTEQGMSSRAIAPIVGVDHVTVARDRGRVANATPDAVDERDEQIPSTVVTGDDLDEIVDAEIVDEKPAVHRPQITGRDNKTYTPPAPRKQRRNSLPDAYRNATFDLLKSIERLERLHADDRFRGNRTELRDRYRAQLAHLGVRLADLETQLSGLHAIPGGGL